MRFTSEVIKNVSEDFRHNVIPYMRELLRDNEAVYYMDIRNFGYGPVPSVLIVNTIKPNVNLENRLAEVFAKYSSDDRDGGGGVVLLQMPQPNKKFKEFCVR